MDIRKILLKWALKNAIDHDGKAISKAVISKALSEYPSLKDSIHDVLRLAEEIVAEVNKMSIDEQQSMLLEIAPNLLEKKKVKEEKKLHPLPNAKRGEVVTRLPPEPSGYMHIGHGMSGLLNYLYARMYDGKLWLRFEDTNPRKVKLEYYESFRRGYRWLGIEWDYEKCNSEDMEIYYRYAEELIRKGAAYVCVCKKEDIQSCRMKMLACKHRDQSIDENLSLWRGMLNGEFDENEAILRLKGDMTSMNTAMRDPTLFRIIEANHPIVGDKYRVWATYDMAVAIEDAICGVTHVLRSSEFMLRDELQNYIRSVLGMPNPIFIEYSRFEFEGVPVAKREIRSLIEKGIVGGWDDPRLVTIDAIRRRGILPEAIREFTITYSSISYTKRVYSWDLLFAINRKLLDPIAKRYFFVPDPIMVKVYDAPKMTVELPHHPSEPLGKRTIHTGDTFYLSRWDLSHASVGETIRLKQLFNIKILRFDDVIEAVYDGNELKPGMKILQWVAEDAVDVEVMIPSLLFSKDGSLNVDSLKIVKGFGESACREIKHDEKVQFERFGFCRRDDESELRFIYIHN